MGKGAYLICCLIFLLTVSFCQIWERINPFFKLGVTTGAKKRTRKPQAQQPEDSNAPRLTYDEYDYDANYYDYDEKNKTGILFFKKYILFFGHNFRFSDTTAAPVTRPPTPAPRSCFHKGTVRLNEEVWQPDDCSSCTCSNGLVRKIPKN